MIKYIQVKNTNIVISRCNEVMDYCIGKAKRLSRIFHNQENCLIVPLDDNLISGVQTSIEDMRNKILQVEKASPDAVLGFQGTIGLVTNPNISTIVNLTASTINSFHTKKVQISSVFNAVRLGADAVAVHVNLTSHYESSMLKILGRVSDECNSYGIPLVVIIYPRGEKGRKGKYEEENYLQIRKKSPEKYTDLVCHCARVAFEMGADLIKTQYTGSVESFKRVVKSASGIPVVIAGGPIVEPKKLFTMIEESIKAGARGISIGRNIFSRKDSDLYISCARELLSNKKAVSDVLENYERRRSIEYMG